nr:MAG TPA: hypothetical protein [Caudoviricetes sp.]
MNVNSVSFKIGKLSTVIHPSSKSSFCRVYIN